MKFSGQKLLLELESSIFGGQGKGRGYFPLFGIGETTPVYCFQVHEESQRVLLRMVGGRTREFHFFTWRRAQERCDSHSNDQEPFCWSTCTPSPAAGSAAGPCLALGSWCNDTALIALIPVLGGDAPEMEHTRLHSQHCLPGTLLPATAPQESSPTLCGELHGHRNPLVSHPQLPRRQRSPMMSSSLEPAGHSRAAK